MPLTDIIGLNVGGVPMATTRATLLSAPSSSLARMFQEDPDSLPPARLKDGQYFLDVDPKAFEVVLHWLRHRVLALPPCVAPEAVATLADCYCLQELLHLVRPPAPPASPLDCTLSRLALVPLCQQGAPLGQQVPEPGGQWVCTRRLPSGSLALPYFRLGPLLEEGRGSSSAELQLRGHDLVVGLDTGLGPRLCLTPGNDTNIWANRLGLVLHLHKLEHVAWLHCRDTLSLPPAALAFSRTQSGLDRFLALVQEGPEVVLGVAVAGRGLRLLGREQGPGPGGFFVLATGKAWDI